MDGENYLGDSHNHTETPEDNQDTSPKPNDPEKGDEPTGGNSPENNNNPDNSQVNDQLESENEARIAACEHRSNHRSIFQAGENPTPIPCHFDSGNGTHLAISRPFEEAILCNNCLVVICADCNAPNSDSDIDSGFGSE